MNIKRIPVVIGGLVGLVGCSSIAVNNIEETATSLHREKLDKACQKNIDALSKKVTPTFKKVFGANPDEVEVTGCDVVARKDGMVFKFERIYVEPGRWCYGFKLIFHPEFGDTRCYKLIDDMNDFGEVLFKLRGGADAKD